MHKRSLELRGFSSGAIVSLNDILSNEEDYKTIYEIVQKSPAAIQNPSIELSIRIHSPEELLEIKEEVTRILEQLNNRPRNYTHKRQLLKAKRTTLYKRRNRLL